MTGEMPEWLTAANTDYADYPELPEEHYAGPDSRPEVKIGVDAWRITEELAAAMARDPLVYERAFALVTVVGVEKPGAAPDPLPRTAPVIRDLSPPAAVLRLTRHVKMIAPVKPTTADVAENTTRRAAHLAPLPAKWREITPPQAIVAQFLAAGEWPGIRRLVGVSESPFLRPDGTICQSRGYDAATGYIYAPSADYPRVDDEPTQAQAAEALALLVDVFRDFPHVTPAARIVPVAALLTLLARPAIAGSIPAFVLEASTRGSGKTLQAHIVSLIALGRFASPATFPEEDEELEKILAGYALTGARLILLDNVTRPFGGAPLDKALTSRGEIDMRVLGSSTVRTLPWQAVMFATGNNVVLPEDTRRRVLVSRLESALENPEDRDDVRDLPAYVAGARRELVRAGLTVLRSFAAHGRPSTGGARWGSFEEWSALIPQAIVFAGGPDALATRPRGDAGDDDATATAALLERLPMLSDAPLTAKQIIALLWPADRDGAPDMHDPLREAIEQLCPPRFGGRPEAKALGERLRRMAGRVIGGRRIVGRLGRTAVREWAVEGVA